MRSSRLSFGAFVLALAVSLPSVSAAQSATIVHPPNGAVNADLSQSIQWSSVPGADYYLWVGTAPGLSNLVNTGWLQTTSFQVGNFPANQTVYARLFTKIGASQSHVDSSFSAAPLAATMTNPVNGSSNADLSQGIQWTTVANAQGYYLWVGTAPGTNNIVNSGWIQTTSFQVGANFPVNQTVYARLYTKVGGIQRYTDSSFAAVSLSAAITNPANGATNADLSQGIQWSSVPNAEAYYLWVGTSPGTSNLVNSGWIQATSQMVGNFPANQTVYARLFTRVAGVQRYRDSSFSAAPLAATMTFPLNGATNAELTQPIQWGSVANAQGYYLWLGTTPGSSNLVNSGWIQATSFQTTNIPTGQTVYARLYTKVAGIQRYTDSTFSALPPASTITYPANGATSADLSQPIQWASVANAEGYYLWVGTAPGLSNLVNTGWVQTTSHQVTTNLPANQTLYARLYTKVGGVQRYRESTFSALPLTSTITSPANGATSANLSQGIQWSSVAGAQAYYLWVGTAPGTSNLVNTGWIPATSFQVGSNFPVDQTVYARLYTKVAGIQRYTESTFSAAALSATLTYPANGATGADLTQPMQWTTVPGAQAYYLWVGTAPGLSDLVNSGWMATPSTAWFHGASLVADSFPANQTLYVRLFTNLSGVVRFTNSTFTAAPFAPEFVYPADGATGVNVSQPFTWTAPAGASAHRLVVGTAPGTDDLFDTGSIATTSAMVTGLPVTGALYARVSSMVNGEWSRHTDIAFTVDGSSPGAMMVDPVDGTLAFDTKTPFEWDPAPLARAYRLTIGSTPGDDDLHNSGDIHITRRFVHALPVGTPLFGRLETNIDGVWSSSDFAFTVAANTASPQSEIKSALWLTDVVRMMADAGNRPYSGTLLMSETAPRYFARSADYSTVLLQVLTELNLSTTFRRLDVAFDPNRFDEHALVELLDPESGRWLLLDPTFDVTVKRGDNSWATAEDVSAASLTFNWGSVSYVFLGEAGDAYARDYYIDYPLLFLNVYHFGSTIPFGVGASPLPYLLSTALPQSGAPAVYAVQCNGSSLATVVADGTPATAPCNGVDSLTAAFRASSVSDPGGQPPVTLYQLQRFVFP